MNNKDNLESVYHSMSNEMPSELTDKRILKAASEALNEDVIESSETHTIKNINQTHKYTSTRKWHMPVSIAAGAIITVTVVTSLEPWTVTPPETAVTPHSAVAPLSDLASQRQKTETTEKEYLTEKFSNEELSVETDNMSIATENKMEKSSPQISPLKKSVPPELPVSSTAEFSPTVVTDQIQASPKLDIEKSQRLERTVMEDPQKFLEQNIHKQYETINLKLEDIENSIKENKMTEAKNKLIKFLEQHQLDTLLEVQKDQLKMLQEKLSKQNE